MKTGMLISPTLGEVKAAASMIDLPPNEAEKFWNYYESNGWRVGRLRMVSFKNALAGWKLRWQERNVGPNLESRKLTGADKMIYRDEYNRILESMKGMISKYDGFNGWSQRDKEMYSDWKARREELRKLLGILI